MLKPQRIPTPDQDAGDGPPVKDTSHRWIGAATVELDQKRAKHADLRGSYRTKEAERVDVLEVYCRGCRRPYEDVAGRPCEARINNEHLIGGNPGERKKRKPEVTPAPAQRQPTPMSPRH